MDRPRRSQSRSSRSLSAHGLKIAMAESCTGGLVSALLTDVSGSSAVLWGGVVAYSNECKTELLGVERETIERHGAVSAETARAMSIGLLQKSDVDLAIGITGIAGPTGGTVEKPVGLVWFSWAKRDGVSREESKFSPAIAGPFDKPRPNMRCAAHSIMQVSSRRRRG